MTDPRTGSAWILGDKFNQVYPHLGSISNLWLKKWKFPCERSLYPFHDGLHTDFEPIFSSLISKEIHDGYTDAYTHEFIPTAEALAKQADEMLEAGGDKEEVIKVYLRACAVYRIARFPYINSDLKRSVYEAQKKTYMKAAALFDTPIQDVEIPHAAGISGKDEGDVVPLYIRIPKDASQEKPVPAVLLMCGLDGHRPDNTVRSDEFLKRGWASIIADIPGTADCPALRSDPTSADRLWTSVLDWIASSQPLIDSRKILAWGLSAGGYNAARAAHTHSSRLVGSVAQGAGMHHFFCRPWLEKAANHEYPWTALPALREKFGYETEEAMLENAQKDWSLVDSGIVNQESCRLLLVNGTHDGLMPIEDSMLMMEYGRPKEGRFFTGLLHMGYPPANGSVYPWMEEVMGQTP
ncbi:Putative esterase FrsA, alpha/Beta hydrolase [Septoria linicola]|uniref:Esterase FrsA, alpha/Beta hydrolase n=1 Tax=Septoria linicola TaxID=215465 RepID=A0A9Q9AWM1_9PEZI|nr:Putative esterase FrsA, alpha/Beta hydrolase [Septoria linicola]